MRTLTKILPAERGGGVFKEDEARVAPPEWYNEVLIARERERKPGAAEAAEAGELSAALWPPELDEGAAAWKKTSSERGFFTALVFESTQEDGMFARGPDKGYQLYQKENTVPDFKFVSAILDKSCLPKRTCFHSEYIYRIKVGNNVSTFEISGWIY